MSDNATAADLGDEAAAPTLVNKLGAEALGTFVLVFFGCGSVVLSIHGRGGVDIAAVGLTFGLAVLIMAYAVGRISGGHFNPAVTLGAAVSGRMAWRDTPVYFGAQAAGALVASVLLLVVALGFDSFDAFASGAGNLGANAFGDASASGIAWWAALILELVLTMLFIMIILGVTDERNAHQALAPLAIGFALAAIHFVAIPATGTSVNPARSLFPGLLSWADGLWWQAFVFVVITAIGGALGGLLYPLIFGRGSDPVPGSGLSFGGGSGSAAAPGQPIIQDGWQWDPQSNQWVPAQQAAPAAPATPATPPAPQTPQTPGQQLPPPGH